ncbi:MAG: LacI family transcriptional regulator [Lachnospiraceae bacterium]|nr:LacI family transcriptional regulator [Lachnospiraceae bacterium]
MASTIKDIRKETGLSLATISKYLNGGNVLPENRIKIEAAVKKLHYEANEAARSLVTKKTRTVGVIVYEIDSVFNGTLLKYIGAKLRERGYGMLICDSCQSVEIEEKNMNFLLSKNVDGIIIVPISEDEGLFEPARREDVPVVLLDRYVNNSDCDCVKIDNKASAKMAVKKLISMGHREIALIGSDAEFTGRERHKGYLEAMEEAGLDTRDEFICLGRHSIEHGFNSMKKLMSGKNRPDAVFLANYDIILGGVMALNNLQVSCPEDVSLIGFDDLIVSHVVKPSITTVVQPMKQMGEKAVELLLDRVENKNAEEPVQVVLTTRLSRGDSISEIKRK